MHKHWTYDHSSQKSEFDNQHRSCIAGPTIELWVFGSEASQHVSTGSGYRLQDTCRVACDHKNENSDHNSQKSEFDNQHKSWVAGPTIELWVFSSEASQHVSTGSDNRLQDTCQIACDSKSKNEHEMLWR